MKSQDQPLSPQSIQDQPQKQIHRKVKSVSDLGSLGISIKNTQKEKSVQTEQKTIEDGAKKRNKFSEDDLQKEWNEMISDIAEEKVLLAETLKTHQPALEKDEVLTITVRNNIQEKEIIENQALILDSLRLKLKNDFVTVSVVVDETKDEVKYMNGTDRLKKMIEINPDLNLLRKKFDLDME